MDGLRCAGCGVAFGADEVVVAEVAESSSLQIASVEELEDATVVRAWHSGCVVVGDE
jgi:hypothetical protein